MRSRKGSDKTRSRQGCKGSLRLDDIPVIPDHDNEYHENGSIKSGYLARTIRIGGVICKKGTEVVFYANGMLRMATLAQNSSIDGIRCRQGDRIFLHPNGKIWNVGIAGDCEKNGLPLKKCWRATFDQAGNVLEYSRYLDTDEIVQGIPCREGTNVWFYRSGNISMGELSKASRIGNRTLPAGAGFELGKKGQLIKWTQPSPEGYRYKLRVYGAVPVAVL